MFIVRRLAFVLFDVALGLSSKRRMWNPSTEIRAADDLNFLANNVNNLRKYDKIFVRDVRFAFLN